MPIWPERQSTVTLIYLAAGVGSRSLSLLSTILLARIMLPNEFGSFILAMNNSLLWAMLSSYWITTSAFRFMVLKESTETKRVISTLMVSIWGAAALAILFAFVSFAARFTPMDLNLLPVAMLICILNIIADVTAASFTAAANPSGYFRLSMRRAAIGCIASIIAIFAGLGVQGALAGQCLGLIVGLLEPDVWSLWKQASWRAADIRLLKTIFSYGVVGSFAFAFYMIIQVMNRNIIASSLGPAAAGQFALVFDIFYAPIGTIAGAISLGAMSTIHSGANEGHKTAAIAISAFFENVLVFAVPYAVGGWLLAPKLSGIIFGQSIADNVGSIASYAAVHGTLMALLSTLLVCIVVLNRKIWLGAALIFAIGANAIATVSPHFNHNIQDFAFNSLVAISVSTFFIAAFLNFFTEISIIRKSIVPLILGTFWMTGWIFLVLGTSYFSIIFTVLSAASVYIAWCQFIGLINLQPIINKLKSSKI